MNRKEYNSDSRYAKVLEQMDLLGIMDISTTRQHKNGTIVWRLPIKNTWWGNKNASFIEVASFSTGYVRNQNSGYSNYQLNKRCESEPEYFKLANGDYRKFTTRACVLIPIEIDRLEYMMKYVVKNYFIKNANQVPNGDFYPKWMYESAKGDADFHEKRSDEYMNKFANESQYARKLENKTCNPDVTVIVNGQKYKVI